MEPLEYFETWKTAARKDLGRAEHGVFFEDWEQVVYYCQQALEKLVKGIFLFF